ncbi:hypothetical protein Droror1_Dr00006470 [Drosera rotundifolia]
MIHATRAFVVNEWIQTKIEGYDVSATVRIFVVKKPTPASEEDEKLIKSFVFQGSKDYIRRISDGAKSKEQSRLAARKDDITSGASWCRKNDTSIGAGWETWQRSQGNREDHLFWS